MTLPMKQQNLGLNLCTRRTGKVVFWRRGIRWSFGRSFWRSLPRPPRVPRPAVLPLSLRPCCVSTSRSEGLSDFGVKEALFEVPLYREFAGLGRVDRIPDRVSLLRFRHLLEEHGLAERVPATANTSLAHLMLKNSTLVDVSLMAAPSSTKNQSRRSACPLSPYRLTILRPRRRSHSASGSSRTSASAATVPLPAPTATNLIMLLPTGCPSLKASASRKARTTISTILALVSSASNRSCSRSSLHSAPLRRPANAWTKRC